MNRESVIQALRAHEAELRAEGISHVYLFGSVARGEADDKSDVDLFYDYHNPRFSLFDIMRVQDRLVAILGTKVDAMTIWSVIADDLSSLELALRRLLASIGEG